MINDLKKTSIQKILFIIALATGSLMGMEEPVKVLLTPGSTNTQTLQAQIEYLKFYHQIPSDVIILGDMPCGSTKIYAERISDGIFSRMIKRYVQLLHDEIDFPSLSPDQKEQFIRAAAPALKVDKARMSYVWTGDTNKIFSARELQPYQDHFKRVVQTVVAASYKSKGLT